VKYFVVQQNSMALCLIRRNNMACLKKINVKRSLQGQQKMISLYKNDSQLGTELSFKFSEAIAEKGKAFSDGEFVKHCLMAFAEQACPDKKYGATIA